MIPRLLAVTVTTSFLFAAGANAQSVDSAAAEALMKANKCTTCHAVDKKKDGPAYKAVAAKYKGMPDANQKLFTHLTTGPKVKVDGKEETHEPIKTKNEADIKNLIAWILAC